MARVSANPETFEGGTAFLDGWETKITGAEYVVFDGNGHWDNEAPCLCLVLENDQLEEPLYQYWSAGSLTNFAPSDDGTYLDVIGKRNGLHPSCNLAALFRSFSEAGAPRSFFDAIDENIKAIVGTKVKWANVKLRKDSKYGTPLIDEIISLPEEAADPAEVAGKVVLGVLEDSEGEIAVRKFPKAATTILKGMDLGDDEAEKVRKLLFSKDFLAGGDGWKTDGKKIVAVA